MLSHALSSLHATKLSQPASPNGFSCLGDPAPSWWAAAASLLHTFTALLSYSDLPQHKTLRWVAERALAHPSSNLRHCGTSPLHICAAQISHRVSFRSTGAKLFLTMSHGTGQNQLEYPGLISQLVPQEQNNFISKLLQRTQICQAYKNVIWICIGSNLSCKLHPRASTSKKTASNWL